MAPGLKKDYLQENEVFDKIYASSSSINLFNKSQIAPPNKNVVAGDNGLNYLQGDAYYFKDSEGIIFKSADLLYNRSQVTKHISLGADIGIFSIQNPRTKYKGWRYGGTLFYDHFSLRLGMNKFEHFSEFVPTLKYENIYKKHAYMLEYTRQNALFYTYSLAPYEKRIHTNHFAISDSITFENNTTLWASAEMNIYSNNDTGFIGQFDWIFFHDKLHYEKFSYDLAIEGWYTTHTKEHTDFYSPPFADNTLFRIDPQYVFSKAFALKGKLGLGYSFKDKDPQYKFGLNAFGTLAENLIYNAGCTESSASQISNGINYYSYECEAQLGYTW